MRYFHSYGPVDCEEHFCVERSHLVERCLQQLIGNPQKKGKYFTIWGSRQTGKTWLLQQMKQLIPKRHGEQFIVHNFSLGTLRKMKFTPSNELDFPQRFSDALEISLPGRPFVKNWKEFYDLFSKDKGLWDRPLILLIDEVDTIPADLLDLMVGQFRELYLHKENNWLHGLALLGVRAVVGLESKRGSPFNIQQSLPVPNLTWAEVKEMYDQYQNESGQSIEPAVVEKVYESTRGQPGLVSWFGELLTKTFNPNPEQPIDLRNWKVVWRKARFVQPNNSVINLIAKAKDIENQPFLATLFTQANIPFSFHDPLHSYLYTHGIIDSETTTDLGGEEIEVCRFSSPFVQDCLFNALSRALIGVQMPILAVPPLDDLADVFASPTLNLIALLERYKDYLKRLKAKGLNPWKKQPRRKTDLQLTEAVGHFHLYSWLKEALANLCILSPEFPTGNGKVDLHLRCGSKQGIIEIKSFRSATILKKDRQKAAHYAKQLGLTTVTMAVFVPVEDETVLAKLSEGEVVDGVQVSVVAIGWV